MTNFNVVLVSPEEQDIPIVKLSLQADKDGIDYNVVAEIPSGRKFKVVGLRKTSRGFGVVRWQQPTELNKYLQLDEDHRIEDFFGHAK